MSRLSLIVAMDENRLIGNGDALPWRLPADLRHFKAITWGKPILMGRHTHQSIGRPLPGRDNLILTRQTDYQPPGCRVFHDLDQALEACRKADEALVIGGAQIYQQALPRVGRIYLTQVHGTFQGDAWFPEWSPEDWCECSREDFPADPRYGVGYSFVRLERRDGT